MTESPGNSPLFSALAPLPTRATEGHKGTFGTVLVIGGCAHTPRKMLGGAMLAARGALRAGAGRVIVAVPEPLAHEALLMLPESVIVPLAVDGEGALLASEAAESIDLARRDATVTLVGPALGRAPSVESMVMRLVSLGEMPLVLDADAIRAFAAHRDPGRDLRGIAVFTPHPGEARMLADSLGLDVDCIERATRPAAAMTLAQRLGSVVVLKGAGTVTSDGLQAWRCDRGNAALATGGSGDVLAGVVSALFAQFGAKHGLSAGTLAALAVEAHARAGDLWCAAHGDSGALAHEIADLIPDAMSAMRRG